MPKNNKNNKTYSKEQREAILAKILPPNNMPLSEVANETGIPTSTLSTWKSKKKLNKKQ
ncbi:UNVERIFIED_CONTAM: transposase [Acetivibrio alkalicellulosi]